MDNYNRTRKTTRWGGEEKIDVVHVMAKPKEIFAPSHLSRTKPSIPLSELTGNLRITLFKL
jgi:hypothetical protein